LNNFHHRHLCYRTWCVHTPHTFRAYTYRCVPLPHVWCFVAAPLLRLHTHTFHWFLRYATFTLVCVATTLRLPLLYSCCCRIYLHCVVPVYSTFTYLYTASVTFIVPSPAIAIPFARYATVMPLPSAHFTTAFTCYYSCCSLHGTVCVARALCSRTRYTATHACRDAFPLVYVLRQPPPAHLLHTTAVYIVGVVFVRSFCTLLLLFTFVVVTLYLDVAFYTHGLVYFHTHVPLVALLVSQDILLPALPNRHGFKHRLYLLVPAACTLPLRCHYPHALRTTLLLIPGIHFVTHFAGDTCGRKGQAGVPDAFDRALRRALPSPTFYFLTA